MEKISELLDKVLHINEYVGIFKQVKIEDEEIDYSEKLNKVKVIIEINGVKVELKMAYNDSVYIYDDGLEEYRDDDIEEHILIEVLYQLSEKVKNASKNY